MIMESSTWTAESLSLSNLRQRMEEKLIRGYELANQLGRVVSDCDRRSAEGLVTKILCSFRNNLSILIGNHEYSGEELIPHIPANASSTASPTLTESSARDTHKGFKSAAAFMDLRGSFRRRNKMTPHAWSRDSLDLNDDGHAWRKYGQKQIQNAIHPRSYFRCSHKYDQGCTATKQVQKLDDDDPQLFRTSYYGNHTCTKSFLKAPELLLDTTKATPTEASSSKFMVIYESSISNSLKNNIEEQHLFSSTKTELIESSHTTGNQSSVLLSSDYLVSSAGTMVCEPSEPISETPPQIELDHLEDIISGAQMGDLLFDQEILPDELW